MVFGKIFIILQNVCTIVLVASAITMFMQVRHLINAPLGYDTKGIMQISYPWEGEKDEAFLSELNGMACVDKVSVCWSAPLGRGNNNTMVHEGKTISLQTFCADSNYMDLLGLKLKKDNHLASANKNYVNMQTLAEFGIDEDAVDFPYGNNRVPIAGITEDFLIGDVLADQHPVLISIGKPGVDFGPWIFLIKVNGDEYAALQQIKEAYNNVYQGYSDYIFNDCYLDDIIKRIYESQHKLSIIIAVFACIAVIISMLGLVAMSTFYVQQRSKEIAVRKVMGGSSASVLTRLVRSFMTYVGIAALISIPVIYYVMSDWLSEYSYRIDLYAWIYAVAIAQALIVCFLSVVVQSRRAANANPIEVLRKND